MTVANEIQELRTLLEEYMAETKVSQRKRIQGRPRDPEVLDKTPLVVPVEAERPPSMRELVHEYVQGALSQQAAEAALGTFQEEDDFEEEDPELLNLSGFEVSDYEMVDEHPVEDAAPPPAAPGEDPPDPPPETEAEAPAST